jgi:gamma-butyrobetaine dioxygenase
MQNSAQPIAVEVRSDFRNYKTERFVRSSSVGEGLLEVMWDDGIRSGFDTSWLQDNCDCGKCLHPTSKEPLLHYTEKDFGGIDSVDKGANGLTIMWNDGHVGFYSNGWLRAHSIDVIESSPGGRLAVPWEVATFKMPTYKYLDLEQPRVFYDALSDLEKDGVVVFTDVPRKDRQVVQFAERIGAIRSTTFGPYFDVLAKIDPNSNAYTALALHPHTDLAHHDFPPAYQLLHFMESEAKGGLSTFVDGLAVIAALSAEKPEVFRQLTRPVYNFRFQDENSDHYYRGAIIELDARSESHQIRLDLTVMAPIIASVDEVRIARAAIKVLFEYVTDPRFQYKCRLNAGDLVVFANTRLLHGRTAFDSATGKRHLQGCYLDRCEVMSRMQVLKRHLDTPDGYVFDDAGKYILNLHT